MKLTKLLTGCLVVILATTTFAGDILNSMPESSNVIAKINLAKMRNSKLYSAVIEKHRNKHQKFIDNIISKSGINPQDISTVWLAGEKKNQGIIVLEGSFNVDRISEKVNTHPATEVVEREGCALATLVTAKHQGNGKKLAVLIDESTIVAGDMSLVDNFLQLYSGKASLKDPAIIEERVAAFGNDALLQAKMFKLPDGAAQHKPMLAGIESGELTIDLGEELSVSAKMLCKNADQAQGLTQLLNGLIMMQKSAQPKLKNASHQAARTSFLKNVSIQQDGNNICASTKLDAATLDLIISNIQALQ